MEDYKLIQILSIVQMKILIFYEYFHLIFSFTFITILHICIKYVIKIL